MGETIDDLILGVTDFVAILNQTLEFAYPRVTIVGELANFRVSKNRWVYFSLKDEHSSLQFFGTVYRLPGPLEDGLMLQVKGQPRLHPQYGFSVNVESILPVGAGSIKKAASLLEAKLRAEGLFADSRKRHVSYPPKRLGLITSAESAGYKDFIKILNHRWKGIEIQLADVQVQGELAVKQIGEAIRHFNAQAKPVEVVVITRGGGSADDLAVFSTEQITRAIAASRIPTLVAIGHETDTSLAELAADLRASTPSHAAQLLVPDAIDIRNQIKAQRNSLVVAIENIILGAKQQLKHETRQLAENWQQTWQGTHQNLKQQMQLLEALSPKAALKRGFVIVRKNKKALRGVNQAATGSLLNLEFNDGKINVEVQ